MRRLSRMPGLIVRHALLTLLAALWLAPILWLVLCSFGVDDGPNVGRFFPEALTLRHYAELLMGSDQVSQFPVWFLNTLTAAVFTCLISTAFVLMTAYAMSCLRFPGRKALMNAAVILHLFPGFLAMIAVYFMLRQAGLTNSITGLVIVYSAGSGVGYLIAKGFFDTIGKSLREAAYLEGANEATVFLRIVLPLSRPIVVYTVIGSFLTPFMDFIYASLILNAGVTSQKTVALGLFSMVDKVNRNRYFAQFCAGGVIVSLPVSVLYLLMQRFYVEGIASGGVKG